MEGIDHPLSELFAQLGLPNDRASIDRFIEEHAPLDNAIRLADAPFWNESQSRFLRETIAQDADWAEVVDHFDARLRDTP